jgi:DNA repair protein RecN (Recombination protein N)
LLLELRVKDFGIIEDINWKLDSGFNVITGETGAGKSLLIDAVELLLIGSASENIIRYGTEQAFIEGVFSFSQDKQSNPVKLFLVDKGLDSEENILSINFEIRRQKPGIIRINGRTTTKTILRQLGLLLIDIHGQSEHLSLLDNKYHLVFLDSYAHIDNLKNAFHAKIVGLNKNYKLWIIWKKRLLTVKSY